MDSALRTHIARAAPEWPMPVPPQLWLWGQAQALSIVLSRAIRNYDVQKQRSPKKTNY